MASQASPIECAARVTSAVAHTSISATVLYTIGGIAIGAAIIATAPISAAVAGSTAAVVAVTGAVFTGASAAGFTISVGKLIDKYWNPQDASEKIEKGVPNVLLEEEKRQAANVSDKTKTDQHQKPPVTGSDCVFIENQPASRRTDVTQCDGVIVSGCPHIFYGGNQTGAGKRPSQVLPIWLQLIHKTIDAIGLVQPLSPGRAPKTARDLINLIVDGADYVNALDNVPGKDFFFLKGVDGFFR